VQRAHPLLVGLLGQRLGALEVEDRRGDGRGHREVEHRDLRRDLEVDGDLLTPRDGEGLDGDAHDPLRPPALGAEDAAVEHHDRTRAPGPRLADRDVVDEPAVDEPTTVALDPGEGDRYGGRGEQCGPQVAGVQLDTYPGVEVGSHGDERQLEVLDPGLRDAFGHQLRQRRGVEDVGATGRGGRERLEEEPSREHLLAVDAWPDVLELRGRTAGLRGEDRAVERSDARADHQVRPKVGRRQGAQHAELDGSARAAAAEHVGERPGQHVLDAEQVCGRAPMMSRRGPGARAVVVATDDAPATEVVAGASLVLWS